jgi:hypothetical protein
VTAKRWRDATFGEAMALMAMSFFLGCLACAWWLA